MRDSDKCDKVINTLSTAHPYLTFFGIDAIRGFHSALAMGKGKEWCHLCKRWYGEGNYSSATVFLEAKKADLGRPQAIRVLYEVPLLREDLV